MKIIISLLLLFSFNSWALDDDCHFPVTGDAVLDEGNELMLQQLNQGIKRDFKRRPLNVKGFHLALSIETNFEAPIIGKDIYWGRIYLKDGDSQNIGYRDDLVAEKNYSRELKNPGRFNYSTYKVSDINSSSGLSLVEAAGAVVNVKSVGKAFSTSRGGRLAIKVKAPSEKARTVVIDVVRENGKISNYLIVNNKRLTFDTLKINASKNFLGVRTILSGVDSIKFYSNGKVIHSF